MNYFSVIIPFLLCAVNSQAAPMVTTTLGDQNPSPPALALVQIPNTLPTVSLEQNPQTQSTSTSAIQYQLNTSPGHCPSETQAILCPEACKPTQPEPTPPTENPEEKPEKKPKGWINGIKNMFLVCYNVAYDKLVGEKGFLTTLPQRFVTSAKASKKPKKSNSNSNNNSNNGKGNTKACCIFYGSGPPVKDDQEETEDETNDHVQPLNCFLSYSNNKIHATSSTPGDPAPVPVVPGTSTKTKSGQTNCCFVGTHLITIKDFIKVKCKPQVYVCARTINCTGAEM